MPRLVLAPDSFKGSLTATAACKAMERGVRRAAAARGQGDLQIDSIPLADGGEGTLDALLLGTNGQAQQIRVRGPQCEQVKARWGLLGNGLGAVEMAEASGLTLTRPKERDALAATSYGTGELIRAALESGCSEILVGIGGSATTDGGIGALEALGARFTNAQGKTLPPGGGALGTLASIDLTDLDPRLKTTRLRVLCDVTNPLYGPQGAAHIYGPQKGATSAQVQQLDSGLRKLAEVAKGVLGHDYSHDSGAGAAGGMGFALTAFAGARLELGIQTVMETARFEERVVGAELVLTGEGALDAQTLSGKTIAGVCRVATTAGIPVVAFGGKVALSGEQQDELGLRAAVPLADGPLSLEECLSWAGELLTSATERTLRLWWR